MDHDSKIRSDDRHKRFAPSRLRLMVVATAGLYVGPLLAGFSSHPWWTVPIFGAFLALWSILYQTASWPRRTADLTSPPVLLRTIFLLFVMLGLAGVSFLGGLGLSTIAGALPLPPAIPLLVPPASIMAAMFIQSPRKTAEFDAFLDDALRQLEGFAPIPEATEVTVAARNLAAKLEALPNNATEPEVPLAIGAPAVHDAALLAAIDKIGVPLPRPACIAAILIVTDPEGAPGLINRCEGAWVFDTVGRDAQLLALFARRALVLLDKTPHLWRDMPYSYDVNLAAVSTSDRETASLLNAFRDRLNELPRLDRDIDEAG